MRPAILAFVLLSSATLALNANAAQPTSAPPAAGGEWCGFHDKSGARVACGYISIKDCRQALDDSKDAVCMPDPSFG